jgi:pimeloyl-ACP methyl ester carboxylesterase
VKVLLAHGLGRTRFSLALLAHALSRAGHRPEFFAYSPALDTHQRILRRLITRMRALSEHREPIALVGHSYGGLLLRAAAGEVSDLEVNHLVMLGTPNQPPRLGGAYHRWPLRTLRGDCGRNLSDHNWYKSLPIPHYPYTLVAGTAGWRGRGGPFRGEANDGLVAVSETRIVAVDEPVLVPVLHTFLMNSRHVHRLILERL